MCGYHMRFGKIRKVVGSLFELWKDREKDVHYGEAVWAVENGQELHSSLDDYYSSYIFQEDDDRREELMFLLPALFSLYWHMTLKFSERERKRGFYDTTMYATMLVFSLVFIIAWIGFWTCYFECLLLSYDMI